MADEESPRTAATWRRTTSHRKSYGTSQRTFEFLRLASSCWLWSCLPASKRSRRWPSSTCCLGTPQLHSPGVDIKGAKATGAHSWVRSCGRQLRLRVFGGLSLEALQAHYAASYQRRRPRKVSTAAALSGEACPWYSPRGLRIWAKEAACSARGVHVCEDKHGTRCVCHTRPRSQKNRSRFFK